MIEFREARLEDVDEIARVESDTKRECDLAELRFTTSSVCIADGRAMSGVSGIRSTRKGRAFCLQPP